MITRISPGLISYQNDRKKDIIIAGNNRGSVNEYATMCIDMRVYEMLISDVGKTPEVGYVQPAEVNDRRRRPCRRRRLSARFRVVAATTWPPKVVASMPRAQPT
jgi:hypothetical protein